jgi:hypothetical protein
LLLLPSVLRRRFCWGGALPAILAAVVPIALFWWWITQLHGVPFGYEKRFLRWEPLLNPKLFVIKLARISLTLGFYLSPFAIAWLARRIGRTGGSDRRNAWVAVAIGTLLAVLLLFAPRLSSIRLYWGIGSVDENVGHYPPVAGLRGALLPAELGLGPLRTNAFDAVALPVAVLSVVTLLFLLFDSRASMRGRWKDLRHGESPSIMAVATLSAILQGMLLMGVWDIYGRYSAPLFTTALVVVSMAAGRSSAKGEDLINAAIATEQSAARVAIGWLYVAIVLMGAYSLISTHDTRARFQAAWDAAEELRVSGVPASQIGLGGIYRGMFVYRPSLAGELRRRNVWLKQLPAEQRSGLLKHVAPTRYWLGVSGPPQPGSGVITTLRPNTWMSNRQWTVYRNATEDR